VLTIEQTKVIGIDCICGSEYRKYTTIAEEMFSKDLIANKSGVSNFIAYDNLNDEEAAKRDIVCLELCTSLDISLLSRQRVTEDDKCGYYEDKKYYLVTAK